MHLLSLASLLPLVGLFLQASADLTVINADSVERAPNSYIVVLKPSTNRARALEHTHRITTYHRARSLEERAGTTGITGEFSIDGTGPSFKGYNVHCDGKTLREILRSPEVQYVEADTKTKADVTQQLSTWGLARISWKELPWPYKYRYSSTWSGIGITVYVVDTGVRVTHSVRQAHISFPHPHLLSTDTYACNTIAGLNWIGRNAEAGKSVVNMSLGGRKSPAVNGAVEALYRKGIVVVVSAGNKNLNASNYSPASAPNAITVAASDRWDWRTYFSNYGVSVDVFAPGVDVLSAWHTFDTAVEYLDGTSMAAPHVAGLAAYFLSSKTSCQCPLTIRNRIINNSWKGFIRDARIGTPNRLAYNGYA